MTAPVIHICGWPGSGKATIAAALAARIGGRRIDNHLMLDAPNALFARGTTEHARLRADLRHRILEAALTLPADVPVIFTDALSDSAADAALFAPTEAFARARGAALHAVTLEIAADENARRLTDPARAGRSKLMDAEILQALRARHGLLRPEAARTLDVTHLSAGQAAASICALIDVMESAA